MLQLYAALFKNAGPLRTEILQKLGIDGQGDLAALNTLQWPRAEVVHVPAQHALSSLKSSQAASDGGAFVAVNAVRNGLTALGTELQKSAVSLTQSEGVYVLQNEKVKVSIKGGEIISFVDLDLDRELVPEGERANKLVLFYDQAMTFWDAWDVEVYHLEQPEYLGQGTVKVLDNGPLRVSLEVHHKISEDSWIKSIISLDAYTPQTGSTRKDILSVLKVECEVEWHECRRFLKVEFPWNIHNDHATYDTHFGIIRQPTHYNTSWDYAKFEVVCHRYADLSEYGYGVSILNDCKYGFETQGNVQRLSLLRSPKGPDEHADMGCQRFKYAIAPHQGSFMEAAVTQAGLNFNNPLELVNVSDPTAVNEHLSAVTINGPPNVFLETVKRGEDDEDLKGHYRIKPRASKSVILRTYEGLGGSAKASINMQVSHKLDSIS